MQTFGTGDGNWKKMGLKRFSGALLVNALDMHVITIGGKRRVLFQTLFPA